MKYNLFFAVLLCLIQVQNTLGQTQTDEQCIIPEPIAVSPSESEWIAIRSQLEPQLSHCLNNSNYFALFGASLLYSNNVDRAVEMLERALLLDPNNGSAQIDYAEALFESGQLLAAIQFNNTILSRGDLPPEVKHFIQTRADAWEQLRHQRRLQATYLYGYSNNLNNATFIKGLDLTTLSGQLQPVTLTDDSRAQKGHYHYVALKSNFYELRQQGSSAISIGLKSRVSQYHNVDTNEIDIAYENETEDRHTRRSWSTKLEYLQYGEHSLYTAAETSFGLYPSSREQFIMPYFTTDLRYIHFNSNVVLDETTASFTPGLALGNAKSRVGLELGYTFNKALGERAGGNRYRGEGSIYWDLALYGGRLISKGSYSESQDEDGYSPLLSNNAARSITATTFTTQYFYPIGKNTVLHGSYYNKSQDSNIELFKTKTQSIDFGFTHRF